MPRGVTQSALLALALALGLMVATQACTTFVVGRKASADGSVMSTHSNDGGGTTDARLVKVPARDFPAGSLRPIFASPENYPRYVGAARAVPQYLGQNCLAGESRCADFAPLGYIPQVNHTFAYFEATYGIMNEKQVSIAESTCSGVFATFGADEGGQALLTVDELSQIAMERASTAKEAVQLMGDLAVQYGFYGEAFSFEGGSESLIVSDPLEAWVFHILADPSGTSAIWVAARVPDDSVAVVANMFSIREVDLRDSVNFLGRADMWDIAEKHGLWVPGAPTDFTATFSDGEYAHKYYSGRRMWGVFHLLAPSAGLPAEYGDLKTDKPYPFAVKVDKPVAVSDMMRAMRYWYDDTPYSTAQGLAGGAFGTPDRYSGGQGEQEVSGSWERTIGIYRSSDSYVTQTRAFAPDGVVWFGPAAAHSTVYTPVLSSLPRAPDCLAYAYQGVYNLSTSYWAFRNLLSVAQIKFSYIIEDMRALQGELENASQQLVARLTGSTFSPREVQQLIDANADRSRDAALRLMHRVLFTYADGDLNYWSNGTFRSQSVGYPAWWLEAVGFEDGEPPTALTATSAKLAARIAERESRQTKDVGSFAPLRSVAEVQAFPTGVGEAQARASRDCALLCADGPAAPLKACLRACFR